MNLEDQTLGDIACNMKGAVRFFSASGIDFFCNGDSLLREELKKKNIDAQKFIQELQNHEFDHNEPDEVDWRKENPNELIAHILERYHSRHRKQFPELIQLAQKVER